MVKTRRPNENFELEEVDVAIVAESTYPFLKGGVSAVVHDIITNNPELTFGIIHIAWDSESPTEYLYDVPGNVLWVDMIYLSMAETSVALQKLFDSTAELNGHSPNEVAKKLMYALDQVTRDNPQPLWDLYDEAVNPDPFVPAVAGVPHQSHDAAVHQDGGQRRRHVCGHAVLAAP